MIRPSRKISKSYIVNIMKNWLICASTRSFPPEINRKRSHRETSFQNDASSRTSCHSHLQLSVHDVPRAFNISPPVFLFLFFREILALILPSFFHWEPLFQVESTYSGHNSRARVSALHFCHPALINIRDEARKRSSSTKGEERQQREGYTRTAKSQKQAADAESGTLKQIYRA